MPEGVVKNKASVINWPKNHWKLVAVFVLVLVIAAIALIHFSNHNKVNDTAQASANIKLANGAYLKGNKTEALEYARKALAEEPNNQTAIGFIATLTSNRAESQKLYSQMLDDYIKTSGAAKNPTPVSYWSEGSLAEKAGETNLAEKYYKESISAGNSSSNSYYKAVAQRSQLALKELQ